MSFVLQRVVISPAGTFGVLLHGDLPFAVTLEPAKALIPAGTYTCTKTKFFRGGYDTYEVTGVDGHTRVLLHIGNYPNDTEGCVLVAQSFEGTWVAGSRAGFWKFMNRADGAETIQLTVVGPLLASPEQSAQVVLGHVPAAAGGGSDPAAGPLEHG